MLSFNTITAFLGALWKLCYALRNSCGAHPPAIIGTFTP